MLHFIPYPAAVEVDKARVFQRGNGLNGSL